MKIKDVNAEVSFELWVCPELISEPLELGAGFISPSTFSTNSYRLRINCNQHKFSLREKSNAIDLNFHLGRGCAHIAEIVQIAADGTALLKVIFFYGEIVEIGDIEVGVDDHIETTAKRNGVRFKAINELGELLSEKCNLVVGNEVYFILLCGPSANKDFQSEDIKNESSLSSQMLVEEKYRAFSIYGERVRIPVQRRVLDKTQEIFFATKIVFKDNQNKEGALRLARGSLTFSDYTKTGKIRALASGLMSQLTSETGSYLKKWDEYGKVEGELLLARAKSVGRIDYHATEQTRKGVKFFVSSISDQLFEGDELEITSKEPLYIQNPNLTWQEYSKSLENEFDFRKKRRREEVDNDSEGVNASIINISKTSIELDLPSVPIDQKFLILSINGDKVQIERRMRARSAVLEGRSANPLLGLLIEDGGVLPDIQRVTKLKPLTPFVKDKIFKHHPTEKQVEAIEIALNTPDIALIQGPPGTGKTTVITAILERLNEEFDKSKSIRGQILVSGFQHDAVENIVSRLSVNALPAVKFGRRSSDSELIGDAVTDKLSTWCTNIAEKIRMNNPQILQTEEQVRLSEFFIVYSLCPSKNNTVNLMNQILSLPRDFLSEEIITEAKYIMNSFQLDMQIYDPCIIRLIRSLRLNETAFKDDGPSCASQLLEALEEQISSLDINVLEKASHWSTRKPLNFLNDLKSLKERLLYNYIPRPDFRVEKPREDVLKLIQKVSFILEKTQKSTNKRDAILAEFLHELENNPEGVREAIEDYNFVYAATTQQSEGTAIRRAKTKFNEDSIKYDTVIIDEAARTSPRDLLIPMSQAEKRIILVGDHRQLPHLVDEEVAKALEGIESSSDNTSLNFITESMFKYLFLRLKKLEEKDGVKRTVTLDAQYRTHPLLGTFASDNFYDKYGEGYRSPLSEEHFKQELQGIHGKAAIWLDVPYNKGEEKISQSRSRYREAEASVIAERIYNWINTDEAVGLSFGVISFYKAQVFAVYEALSHYDITERVQDGSWQISQKYRYLDNNEERLRIGTVDAFQGMEFDVVFLSIVRSQDLNHLPKHIRNEENYEKRQQKLFGHLMSENRLCVSMSRQKKVLVLVGDANLINSKIAVDAVPALKNYYDLCKDEEGIL